MFRNIKSSGTKKKKLNASNVEFLKSFKIFGIRGAKYLNND